MSTKTKKWIAVILCLVMALASTACGSTQTTAEKPATAAPADKPAEPAEATNTADPYADFKPVVLRVGHAHNEQEVPHLEMVNMANAIAERTNGKITVEIYPNNSIGSNEDAIEQMRLGTNLAFYTDCGRLDTYVPGMCAISAPYVIEGFEDNAKLKDLPLVQEWTKKLEDDFGLTVLAFNWCQGFRAVFSNKGGTSPADFANVQLRSATSPIWVGAVETIGATAVPLELGETYSAIQTKLVDGCENNYGNLYNSAIYEVANTLYETRHVFHANTVVISSAWLRALPEEFQQIIIEECQAAGARTSQRLAESDNSCIEDMVNNHGVTFIPYEDMDIDAFKANAEKVYKNLGIVDQVAMLKEQLGK